MCNIEKTDVLNSWYYLTQIPFDILRTVWQNLIVAKFVVL